MKTSYKVFAIIDIIVVIIMIFMIINMDSILTAVVNFLTAPTYYEENQLLYRSAIDGGIYQYSGKVKLSEWTHGDELLIVNVGDDCNKKEFFDEEYTVLKGEFERHSWNDYELYVLMDNVYYVFDIENYNAKSVQECSYNIIELKEYSKEEFVKLYPDYESFDWHMMDTEKECIFDKTRIELPESSEILLSKEYIKNFKFYNGYVVQLKEDAETDEYIEKIKSKWQKPPLDSWWLIGMDYSKFEDCYMFFSDDDYGQDGISSYIPDFSFAVFDEENRVLLFSECCM